MNSEFYIEKDDRWSMGDVLIVAFSLYLIYQLALVAFGGVHAV